MDELLEQFLIESRELVAQAARDFAVLGATPHDRAALDSAFRAFHTLKGSFAIFALAPAERLLHGAEDVLEGARRGSLTLTQPLLAGLVACLDQIDRWIDAMEQQETLPGDADAVAERMLVMLAPAPAPSQAEASAPPSPPDWLAGLAARETAFLDQATAPLTAFRYTPDADCFFRGEDPLAVIDAVPGLEALAILPTGGAWPQAETLDPFTCFCVLEGLSSAPRAEVQAAFRLQPDQVELAVLPPRKEAEAARPDSTLLRVDAKRIDALADGLGQLLIAINALSPLARDLEGASTVLATRLRSAQADVERIATGLHADLAHMRLVTLEPVLRRLPRAAREIAQALGKDIAFSLEGETVEADKQIAEGLFEPLLHLMRNAIDHGIEDAETRQARGKPPQGQVRLTLAREGDAITATLTDDGQGLDPKRLRSIAVERGLIADTQVLDDAAAMRLIFRPGFSTARAVTDLSGRGVGMDAVQAAVARLRGTIDIESEPGAGTLFRLRFPAHALTTRLLLVRLGGETYGIALDQMAETTRIEADAIHPLGTGQACVLRGVTVPVVDLAALLDLPPADDPLARLVVSHVAGRPVALRVGGFAGRIDTMLRPPRGLLARTHGIMGSALLGDGSVLLVLDLPELAA